jgi:hypothetical protein
MRLSSTAESGNTFFDIDGLARGFRPPPNVTDTRHPIHASLYACIHRPRRRAGGGFEEIETSLDSQLDGATLGLPTAVQHTSRTTDMMNANVEAAGETGDRLARQTKDMMDISVKAAGDAGDKLAASVTQHSKKAS